VEEPVRGAAAGSINVLEATGEDRASMVLEDGNIDQDITLEEVLDHVGLS